MPCRPEYIRDVDYYVVKIIFEMMKVGYDVLTLRLLYYFDTFPNDHYVPHSILFRSLSLNF